MPENYQWFSARPEMGFRYTPATLTLISFFSSASISSYDFGAREVAVIAANEVLKE